MSRVFRRAQARRDLLEIWAYVAGDDVAAADRLLSRIEETLALIADHPGMGTPRDQWLSDGRSFVVGRYVLLYQPISRGIRLVRVLHGSRDIAKLLRDR